MTSGSTDRGEIPNNTLPREHLTLVSPSLDASSGLISEPRIYQVSTDSEDELLPAVSIDLSSRSDRGSLFSSIEKTLSPYNERELSTPLTSSLMEELELARMQESPCSDPAILLMSTPSIHQDLTRAEDSVASLSPYKFLPSSSLSYVILTLT